MRIFVDESGNFSKGSEWGLVCSIALPDKEVGPARRKLEFLTRDWPRRNGELKGGSLGVAHLAELVEILFQRSALSHACAIHVASEDFAEVERHKADQCEGMTRHLTEEHHPELSAAVFALRSILEGMPAQLYLQCLAQSELVESVITESTAYFAQRKPRELAAFRWTVDAKSPHGDTSQETWWRDTLGPLLEAKSLREPWPLVRDPAFDYRHFERSFGFEKRMWFPDRPRETVRGFSIGKIVGENLSFADSRTDILLQAVDILASFLRRALSGSLDDPDIGAILGRLQIARRPYERARLQTVHLVSASRRTTYEGVGAARLSRLLRAMTTTSRPMMRPRAHRRPS